MLHRSEAGVAGALAASDPPYAIPPTSPAMSCSLSLELAYNALVSGLQAAEKLNVRSNQPSSVSLLLAYLTLCVVSIADFVQFGSGGHHVASQGVLAHGRRKAGLDGHRPAQGARCLHRC